MLVVEILTDFQGFLIPIFGDFEKLTAGAELSGDFKYRISGVLTNWLRWPMFSGILITVFRYQFSGFFITVGSVIFITDFSGVSNKRNTTDPISGILNYRVLDDCKHNFLGI